MKTKNRLRSPPIAPDGSLLLGFLRDKKQIKMRENHANARKSSRTSVFLGRSRKIPDPIFGSKWRRFVDRMAGVEVARIWL
jgi:hypothetical protein